MTKLISERVIERLPKYYRYLKELSNNQIQRVSSKTISNSLNITASQVRQDLSHFGGFGQTGVGYDVEYLKTRMQEILGLNKHLNAIVVGGGRIGQALISYKGFSDENINIKAVLKDTVGQKGEIFVKDLSVNDYILTDNGAQQVTSINILDKEENMYDFELSENSIHNNVY